MWAVDAAGASRSEQDSEASGAALSEAARGAHGPRARGARHATSLPPPLQTPASARYAKATTSAAAGWPDDLEALLAAPGRGAAAATRAAALAAALRASPTSADAWWAFLAHEEKVALDAAPDAPSVPPPPPPGGRPAEASLLRLYEAATRAVPRGAGGPAYVRLWLGLARRAWARRGADDGRDVFKALRSQARAGACAYVAAEWAALEASAGGGAKARGVLAKAREAGARPVAVLDAVSAALDGAPIPNGVLPWHLAPLEVAAPPPPRPPPRAAAPGPPPAPTPTADAPTTTTTLHGGSCFKEPRRIGLGATPGAGPRPTPRPRPTPAAADDTARTPATLAAGPPKRKASPAAVVDGKRRSPADADAAATALAATTLGSAPRGRPLAAPTVMRGGATARAVMGAAEDATTRPLGGGARAPPPPQAAPPAAPAPPPPPTRPREDDASVLVRGTRYAKLECVGRGGSSKVFKVMAPSRKIYALKRIRLSGRDAEAAQGFVDEIGLLTRLRGEPGIVRLVDAEVVPSAKLIFVVLEYGDIDLARLLAKQQKAAAAANQASGRPAAPDGVFIRLYWRQMLDAVATIHAARIVHSDLKPANFLVVEGALKLIDFGIAKAIGADTTSIARESQVGTLNYMSPEAVLGGGPGPAGADGSVAAPARVGRASDVWSLGCILYQMAYGATPFAHLPFVAKLHAVTDPSHEISYPPLADAALADCIRRCLVRDASRRATLEELLAHPFLQPGGGGGGGGGAAQPPPAGDAVALTRDQLAALLAQAAAAGAAGADVRASADDVFRQLRGGGGGEGGGGGANRAPPPPPPPAPPPSSLDADLAAMRFDGGASSAAASSAAASSVATSDDE